MYNPWLAFGCTLIVLLVISTPLFRAADAPPSDRPQRQQAIDGLRGFAAFGVFLHHAAITHDYIAQGVWQLPPSRFFSMVGQVGVSVFFLITGYLFWSKLIRERGRPNWFALYVGRVFRIGPVYVLAITGMLLVVFAGGGWTPVEGGQQLLSEAARWLSLGIFSGVPVNGDIFANLYLAGVTWSLQYEWAFYAALAALSIGAWREGWALPFTIVAVLCCLIWWYVGGPFWITPFDSIFALLFAGGMACASLEARGLTVQLPRWVLSAGCLAAVVATFVLVPFAFGLLPTLLLSLAFYLVISGGDLLGMLRSRAARRLGDVSFGIYMLQGLVLTVVFHPQAVKAYALASRSAYWSVVLAAAIALISVATAAHCWLERPGIRAGREFIGLFTLRGRKGSRPSSAGVDAAPL